MVEWLRKLGIVRLGTKKYTYTSGRDMPSEALMDDVYDAKKDLLFNVDMNKKEDDKKGGVQEKSKKEHKMWKKILGTIVVVIGIFIGLVMWGTSGMTDAANEFFILVKTKNYDDAYNETSTDFKQSVPFSKFEAFIKNSGLSEYKSASWNSRSIENNIGRLEGSVTTKNGDTIPVTMEFLKNGDSWKLFNISKQTAGVTYVDKEASKEQKDKTVLEQKKDSIPDTQQLVDIIQTSTFVFAQSVNKKSMSDFYGNISKMWQQQTDTATLDKVFDVFYKADIDLTVLQSITPILDKAPVLEKGGKLVLQGHYPTKPLVAYFDYSYIKENGQWKLVGFNIHIK